MNQQLFDRGVGSLGPRAFERIQTSKLVYASQLSLSLRFDGEQVEIPQDDSQPGAQFIHAHRSGINALAVDRFDGKL